MPRVTQKASRTLQEQAQHHDHQHQAQPGVALAAGPCAPAGSRSGRTRRPARSAGGSALALLGHVGLDRPRRSRPGVWSPTRKTSIIAAGLPLKLRLLVGLLEGVAHLGDLPQPHQGAVGLADHHHVLVLPGGVAPLLGAQQDLAAAGLDRAAGQIQRGRRARRRPPCPGSGRSAAGSPRRSRPRSRRSARRQVGLGHVGQRQDLVAQPPRPARAGCGCPARRRPPPTAPRAGGPSSGPPAARPAGGR